MILKIKHRTMKKKELLKRIEALEAIVKPIAELQRAEKNAKESEGDKFAELKKAYNNGSVIQILVGDIWVDWELKRTPKFRADISNYRIKPDEKKDEIVGQQQYTPKVGDVVKAWEYEDCEKFIIGELEKVEDEIYEHRFIIDNNSYFKVEPITDENIIKLFN